MTMSTYNTEPVDRYVFIPRETGEYQDAEGNRGDVIHAEPGVKLATNHTIHYEMVWTLVGSAV